MIYGDIKAIIVETEEKEPVTIAVITEESITPADGYRVRLIPEAERSSEYERADCEDCKHYDDVNGHCFFIGRCTYEPKEQTERRDHETD